MKKQLENSSRTNSGHNPLTSSNYESHQNNLNAFQSSSIANNSSQQINDQYTYNQTSQTSNFIQSFQYQAPPYPNRNLIYNNSTIEPNYYQCPYPVNNAVDLMQNNQPTSSYYNHHQNNYAQNYYYPN